jgi:hypothetical protein
LLAKRKAHQNKRDEKEPARRRRVVHRISEVCVKRGGRLEDCLFHNLRILAAA